MSVDGDRGRAVPIRATIGSAFDPRSNSINALRLGLAILVIVSHSWPLGGYGVDPGFGGSNLGGWAVAGFFATSGYLITGSRLKSRTLLDYLWRRFLRIYPAFLVVMVLVAFVIAPLASAFLGAGPYDPIAGARFFFSNIGLYVREFGISGMLESNPHGAWNGSLWTLFYEFVSYIVIGLLVSVFPANRVRAAVVTLFAGLSAGAGALAAGIVHVPAPVDQAVTLTTYFLAGSILYLFRDEIPLTWPLAIVAAALFVVVVASGTFRVLAGLPVAYVMMALAVFLPLQRIGSKNDISYGMYIYAFPVQQLLTLAFVDLAVPVWAYLLIAIALTIPLAWASWLLVERNAMKLKRLTARTRVDVEGHVIS